MSESTNLIGLKVMGISEEKQFNNNVFPLTFYPDENKNLSECLNVSKSNIRQLDSILKKHKAILFRGFDVKSYEDFHEVVESTLYLGMEYLGFT